MITSRSSSRLERGQARFLPGPASGHHHSHGGGGPLNSFVSYSNPYGNSSSYPRSHTPPSPTHTTHSRSHSHSSGSSQPTSPCLDNFSTTAWLGPVAEDEEVPVSGLHHHHRHPSNTRLKDHHIHHPSPSPPLRLSCASTKRAPPSLPFSRTDTNLDDLILNPIASTPEPLNSWFERRKSEELELVQKRRFRPKMSPPQQQQPPTVDPRQYWGYLISPDHPTQPTPLFRNLLLSIANYIIDFLEPRDIHCLTPEKISGFYRSVGGDLDELFLGTPPEKLSGIYTTLGCNHTLQPIPDDDFVPPSIPALTPRGFAIWQTIQLLLDPEEHVPYLQEAVRKFQLANPETGELFPKSIPNEAFPSKPDEETVKWHDDMFEKKSLAESAAAAAAAMPVPGAMPGPMPGTMPPEEPAWNGYHHGSSHQQYTSSSRPKRKSKKSGSRHKATVEEVVDEGLYARPPPIIPLADPYGTHHHGHRAHTHHAEPFNSDTESHHHHGSRSHSQRRREYPVSYVTQNGLVTPVVPVYPNGTATLIPEAIHVQTEELSPTLAYRHTTRYASPPIAVDPTSSCSSSYSDLHNSGSSPYHHSSTSSPHHHSSHHPHSATAPTRRSSSPLCPEPHLRKSASAYYYTSHPPAPAPPSRSRSGGSSRGRRHSHIITDDSDSAEEWVLKSERLRDDEDQEERRRRKDDHARRRKAEMLIDREIERERERERERSDPWAGYERKSRSSGNGNSAGGGRYSRDRGYTHGNTRGFY
ncbi:hypothetical protein L873DRAFT_1699005 [Choiromyces venosus 120613-1]|uniref:DUF7514 domain-containing protein n=1 Tax=Choiromyces venosus 120613-1 TaxID=1336337 RepID=A0A3N4JA36_9PEZI|nr:hypothetical protein L873DRAFT_1699005 [Choiromyces venosus 120613-1]